MPDDKGNKDTSIPPPLDPFPTYQTPFPRSNKDDENPFIQFRRFADEQFSSFFHGIPNLFGLSSPGDRWRAEVDDLMRQRQQWEEGFRKQFEQDMEEMRQHLEKSNNDALKAMDGAWKPPKEETPWWTRGSAARCPALNGEAPQGNAKKCPALYDESGRPKTELDAYDAIQTPNHKRDVQVFQAPSEGLAKAPSRSWFSALGWDGKQQEKESSNSTIPRGLPSSGETRTPRPTMYGMWSARRMNPFEDTNDTIPWLMLSPYSPIYLCNPAQSRLFKVKIQDSEGMPLQISSAKYFERWYTEVDEKMATKLPWADAFEDLLSLQQTGKMVERDYSTWRTPKTWIHDMASRGSLGNRWGFNEDGLLVKRVNETQKVEVPGTRKDRCRWRKEHGWGRPKNSESTEHPKQQSATGPDEKEQDFVDDLVDKVTEPLTPYPLFGSILSAADAIVSAIDQAQKEGQEAMKETAQSTDAASTEESTSSYSTSSSSSSSYSYDSSVSSALDNSGKPSKSIVSTLTSTITRTLPDGSIETKRVLKRRFNDGSEESDESVEVKNLPSTPREPQQTIGDGINSRARDTWPMRTDKQTQTTEIELDNHSKQPGVVSHTIENASIQDPTPTQPDRHGARPRRGGGWFWN